MTTPDVGFGAGQVHPIERSGVVMPLDDGADEVAGKLADALERCPGRTASAAKARAAALAAYEAYVERVYGPQD